MEKGKFELDQCKQTFRLFFVHNNLVIFYNLDWFHERFAYKSIGAEKGFVLQHTDHSKKPRRLRQIVSTRRSNCGWKTNK